MSRTFHNGERRIRVRAIRRERIDARRLARLLIELAEAQLEAEAEQQHEQQAAPAVEPAKHARETRAADERNAA